MLFSGKIPRSSQKAQRPAPGPYGEEIAVVTKTKKTNGNTLTNFTVKGPVKVPVKKYKGGKTIDTTKLNVFWKDAKTAERIGCYIFAVRAGKGGIAPWYVGQTTNDFAHECFTPPKIAKYLEAIAHYKAGTAQLFFVVAPRSDTAQHKITELERFLIETAWAANPELLNQRGKKELTWAIPGVTKSTGKGAAPAPVKGLRKALRLEVPKAKPEGL